MSDKKALGRGLSALLSDVDLGADYGSSANFAAGRPRQPDTSLPIEVLHPNPNQPRRGFDAAALAELAQSIREHGIIQPLIVRPHPEKAGQYQIVAGERRWRAAQEARIHDVPVLIREIGDAEALQVAIIENIQRADLNPMEEAQSYRTLMDNFGHTQEKLAEALGKSRSHIANMLRLLTLPEKVMAFLRDGKITTGHARACLAADDPTALAVAIVELGLSVREAEERAKAPKKMPGQSAAKDRKSKDTDTILLEQDLSALTGFKISIEHVSNEKGGELRIRYRNLDELDAVVRLLSVSQADSPA